MSADARWCGQCFRSLVEPAPPPLRDPSPVAGTRSASGIDEPPVRPLKTPSWPCPACGTENPIEADVCLACGTSFAALMRKDETPDSIDPKEAVRWSLVYPGLGHRRAGRPLDGLARGVLFALVLIMALLTGLSATSTPVGLGLFLLLLYLLAAIIVYVGTAYEAARIAEGAKPFVGARKLLWFTVALVLGSVVVLASTAVLTARR